MNNAPVTLEDILHVVPQITPKVEQARQFVHEQYQKAKGKSIEECFALGILCPLLRAGDEVLELHPDERVMILLGIFLEERQGIRINPKWGPVLKIAGLLKNAPRSKRREILAKLRKVNAKTPFDLENKG